MCVYSSKRGIAMVICPSVSVSVCSSVRPSVCNVSVSWPYRPGYFPSSYARIISLGSSLIGLQRSIELSQQRKNILRLHAFVYRTTCSVACSCTRMLYTRKTANEVNKLIVLFLERLAYKYEYVGDRCQGCRGYGDSHRDSHGYGYGMGMGTLMNPHGFCG